MSYETVELRRAGKSYFDGLSEQEVRNFAFIGECSDNEQRVLDYYLQGKSHIAIAQQFQGVDANLVSHVLESIEQKVRTAQLSVHTDRDRRSPSIFPIVQQQVAEPISPTQRAVRVIDSQEYFIDDWRTDARCKDADPTDFDVRLVGNHHDKKGENVALREENKRQKELIGSYCASCVVTVECLGVAIDQGTAAGMIWGGLTPNQITQKLREQKAPRGPEANND